MLPAHGWAAGIAYLTVAFSVGQALGPLVAGLLSDSSGGITEGLWLSVVLLAVAGATALLQRESAAPAAVIIPAVSSTPGSFGRILLTVDGAPHSTAAEQAAVTLSRALGARLDVVHVDPDTEPGPAPGQSPAGAAVLDAAVGRLTAAGVTPVGHLVHAPDVDIPDALAETVARLGADLVIAAPHHRAHLQRWLEPSVSEELADRAKAAVLLVA
jgi:nucleotide-binding universal stress UspA family protein